ncbi:MAG TPA: tRNA (N(6)-L-threonylcarbamoyladenosine(37)-C(2))-methylthiotransferase MtaB [Victivallales bacterium]|nr:tRNA (N(6)-L-threonylcarbamoyladenosine(37)-C(2))-methylthiotransferase MtaB [Victivallales bacterium]
MTILSKKVFITTLGCRLNQADEALIYSRLSEIGYKPTTKEEKKDLIIVNTCTVTASAAQKSRQVFRKLKQKNPFAKIAVTGCDVELNENFWKYECGCDFVIKSSEKHRIAEIISEKENAHRRQLINSEVFIENATAVFSFKNRALVKIQEGCNSFCAYCIVPFTRGKPRSRAFNEIIDECKKLLEASHHEIVLTGVNICRYNDNGKDLSDLLYNILELNGDFRIRLSSTEPDAQLFKIISLMKEKTKLCRFLHIPIQHGSDEILKLMRRHHNTDDFAEFAEFAVNKIDGIHLGTDFICGLPGETEELFEKSINFLKKLPLANIHIFRYSPRIGTDAAKFPDRPANKDVFWRMKILEKLKEELSLQFIKSQVNKIATFIGEKKDNNMLIGWSDNYIKTIVKGSEQGKLTNIKFIKIMENKKLLAELIK